MPIELIVNNQPYNYPLPGDPPGWGQDASGWAEAVTLALQDLQSPTDIPQTTFTVSNNVSSASNVTGLAFNTGLVRAAFIKYSIYRTSTSNPSGNAESGYMTLVYDNLATSGTKWSLSVGPMANGGAAGVTFTVTDAGQVQYQSTNLGSGYSGVMKFQATTLGQ